MVICVLSQMCFSALKGNMDSLFTHSLFAL